MGPAWLQPEEATACWKTWQKGLMQLEATACWETWQEGPTQLLAGMLQV